MSQMKEIQRSYTIDTKQQLVDLNGSFTNFRVVFDLRAGGPFYAVVANQYILDSGENLNFKPVSNGELMGEFTVDKNEYQNYFLVLKADQTIEVNVKIQFEPLPDYIPATEDKKEDFTFPSYSYSILYVIIGLAVGFASWKLFPKLLNFIKNFQWKKSGKIESKKPTTTEMMDQLATSLKVEKTSL